MTVKLDHWMRHAQVVAIRLGFTEEEVLAEEAATLEAVIE